MNHGSSKSNIFTRARKSTTVIPTDIHSRTRDVFIVSGIMHLMEVIRSAPLRAVSGTLYLKVTLSEQDNQCAACISMIKRGDCNLIVNTNVIIRGILTV